MKTLLAFILLLFVVTSANARSRGEVRKFKATHPCPATNLIQHSCPGYIVDHIIPLCKCGKDKVANMQWQTIAEAKAKDKIECKQP